MNIIFDFDGTLHETMAVYKTAFLDAHNMLVERGLMKDRVYEDGEISKWLGCPNSEMLNAFGKDLDDETKEEVGRIIGDSMAREIRAKNGHLYDGIEETLAKLKKQGHTLLILSNCLHRYGELNREVYNLDKYITKFYCAEDFNWAKKHEIFKEIKDKYEGKFIMIGDRHHDIDLATINNIDSIGCLYGFGKEEELKEATILVNSPKELLRAIEKLDK